MPDASKRYFIDFQGFTEIKNFILKELCILECSDLRSDTVNVCEKKIHHYIFKPPFEWNQLSQNARTYALWLKCFHHGFSWKSGDTEYSEIETIFDQILKKDANITAIYVKGAEKIEWFKMFTKGKFACFDIDEMNCSVNLSDLEHKKCITDKHCHRHDASLHCALQNVDVLHRRLFISQ